MISDRIQHSFSSTDSLHGSPFSNNTLKDSGMKLQKSRHVSSDETLLTLLLALILLGAMHSSANIFDNMKLASIYF
jgi:hypothetical protein